MKKILSLCVLICLYLAFSETVSYGLSFYIRPPSIHVSVKPGGTASGTITVLNKDYGPLSVVAYTQDWLYDQDGNKVYYDAGTTPFSCAKWIRLFPKKSRLEGNTHMGVQYTIEAPEDAKGGYYAMIFFEMTPLEGYESEGEDGMIVKLAGRLGATVYVDTEGRSIYKGTAKILEVTPPQSDKPFEMKLQFENTGNVYIGASGILNITDEEGNVLGKESFGPLYTLPGDKREVKIGWLGELKEGTYYAVATLDIGSATEPIVKEAKFSVLSEAVINALSVDASSERALFSVLVENRGHLNIDAAGRIDVLKNGKVLKSLNLKKSLIAPGKEKGFEAILEESLPAGVYTAKAVIFIGDKELIKEEVFSAR